MDTMTRNQIFMENEEIITRVMRRNAPLLRALRLEWDDVYQELAVAMLNAIKTFDPARSESLRAHIWMKLQYAVLDIKRRHSPHGMTAMGNSLSPPVLLCGIGGGAGLSPAQSRLPCGGCDP